MSFIKRLQRFFSTVVVITFFSTNTLTPAPIAYGQTVENPASFFAGNSFSIPAEFGKVTDRIKSPDSSSLLIHIQEAHANYDAQNNIRNILQHLYRNYGVQLILMEGAGNKLTPELFNIFPREAELQKKANEKLMQAGELTGAEVFLVDQESATRNKQHVTEEPLKTSVNAPEAYGVEDAKAYAEGRASYRKVYAGRKIPESFFEASYLHWQKAADRALNKPLREFLDRESAFEEERLPLQEWMTFLKMAAASDLALDLEDIREQLDWPALVRYFRLKKIASQIDPEKTRKEQEAFLAELYARKIPATLLGEITKLLENKNAGDLPPYETRFAFEKLMDLLPRDYSFELYPVFRLHLQQLILSSELKGEQIREEIGTLTQKIAAARIKTDQDRELFDALRHYRLLKKLFRLELDRKEFLELQSQKLMPVGLAAALKLDPSKWPTMTPLFEAAIRFYELAIEREDYMMRNTLKILAGRKDKKAVLITGGFHTEGFKEKIAASGSSYIGITPAIGEITADSQKNYLAAFLGAGVVSKSQQAPVVRSGLQFLKDVSPDWRREWAGIGARVAGIVRSEVSPEGAQAVRRNFVAAAAGVAVQSEVRGSQQLLFQELNDSDPEIAAAALERLKRWRDPEVPRVDLEDSITSPHEKRVVKYMASPEALEVFRGFSFAAPETYVRTAASFALGGVQIFFRQKANGHLFMDPMPGPGYFQKYYDDTYFEGYLHDGTYLDREPGKRKSAQNILRFMEENRPDSDFSLKGIKVLEVGAGAGFLLDEGKRRYQWDAEGVEMVPEFARNMEKLGIKVHQGLFEKLAFDRSGYDMVILKDVLEHTSNPEEILARVGQIVKPGGVVFIEIPLMDKYGVRFGLLEHVQGFTKQSIQDMLAAHGFSLQRIEVSEQKNGKHPYEEGRIIAVRTASGRAPENPDSKRSEMREDANETEAANRIAAALRKQRQESSGAMIPGTFVSLSEGYHGDGASSLLAPEVDANTSLLPLWNLEAFETLVDSLTGEDLDGLLQELRSGNEGPATARIKQGLKKFWSYLAAYLLMHPQIPKASAIAAEPFLGAMESNIDRMFNLKYRLKLVQGLTAYANDVDAKFRALKINDPNHPVWDDLREIHNMHRAVQAAKTVKAVGVPAKLPAAYEAASFPEFYERYLNLLLVQLYDAHVLDEYGQPTEQPNSARYITVPFSYAETAHAALVFLKIGFELVFRPEREIAAHLVYVTRVEYVPASRIALKAGGQFYDEQPPSLRLYFSKPLPVPLFVNSQKEEDTSILNMSLIDMAYDDPRMLSETDPGRHLVRDAATVEALAFDANAPPAEQREKLKKLMDLALRRKLLPLAQMHFFTDSDIEQLVSIIARSPGEALAMRRHFRYVNQKARHFDQFKDRDEADKLDEAALFALSERYGLDWTNPEVRERILFSMRLNNASQVPLGIGDVILLAKRPDGTWLVPSKTFHKRKSGLHAAWAFLQTDGASIRAEAERLRAQADGEAAVNLFLAALDLAIFKRVFEREISTPEIAAPFIENLIRSFSLEPEAGAFLRARLIPATGQTQPAVRIRGRAAIEQEINEFHQTMLRKFFSSPGQAVFKSLNEDILRLGQLLKEAEAFGGYQLPAGGEDLFTMPFADAAKSGSKIAAIGEWAGGVKNGIRLKPGIYPLTVWTSLLDFRKRLEDPETLDFNGYASIAGLEAADREQIEALVMERLESFLDDTEAKLATKELEQLTSNILQAEASVVSARTFVNADPVLGEKFGERITALETAIAKAAQRNEAKKTLEDHQAALGQKDWASAEAHLRTLERLARGLSPDKRKEFDVSKLRKTMQEAKYAVEAKEKKRKVEEHLEPARKAAAEKRWDDAQKEIAAAKELLKPEEYQRFGIQTLEEVINQGEMAEKRTKLIVPGDLAESARELSATLKIYAEQGQVWAQKGEIPGDLVSILEELAAGKFPAKARFLRRLETMPKNASGLKFEFYEKVLRTAEKFRKWERKVVARSEAREAAKPVQEMTNSELIRDIMELESLNEGIITRKVPDEKLSAVNELREQYVEAVREMTLRLSQNLMCELLGQWRLNREIARSLGRELIAVENTFMPIPLIHKLDTLSAPGRRYNGWKKISFDNRVLRVLVREAMAFEDYLQDRDTWVRKNKPELLGKKILYFSAEFGMKFLQIYSGGLGILSGDHVRGASDIGLDGFTAVGLLYKKGYFRQRITAAGQQLVDGTFEGIRLEELPIDAVKDPQAPEKDLVVKISFPRGRKVLAKVWKAVYGKTNLYLLDTDIEGNSAEDRAITQSVYRAKGESTLRMEQYHVLGTGGMLAMHALGIRADALHLNDCHPMFAAIQEVASLMQSISSEQYPDEKVRFEMALMKAVARNVFTTHTPIPAGNEAPSIDVIRPFIETIFPNNPYAVNRMLSLGFLDGKFNIAAFSQRVSMFHNGVSKLHGRVAQAMWKRLYPGVVTEQVPIAGIVNSVHGPYWQNPDLRGLFKPVFDDPKVQALMEAEDQTPLMENLQDDAWVAQHIKVSDDQLWNFHLERKQKLLTELHLRLLNRFKRGDATGKDLEYLDTFDPEALTIGFARRAIGYKRMTLIFQDLKRLAKIAVKSGRPIQLVFGGKAHPEDGDGQGLILRLHRLAKLAGEEAAREENIPVAQAKIRFFFVEEYNVDIARYLESGVDVWLNTPVRPHEASGTSGMKAAMNGVLNMSISDGWSPEGIVDGVNGWLFGMTEGERNDPADAEAFYKKLETIVDLYNNHPDRWIRMFKASVVSTSYRFGMERMLREYIRQEYAPAVQQGAAMTDERASLLVQEQIARRNRILERRGQWEQVTIEPYAKDVVSGSEFEMSVVLNLKGLQQDDLAVDMILDGNGSANWVGMDRVEPLADGKYRFVIRTKLDGTDIHRVQFRIMPRDRGIWLNIHELAHVTKYVPSQQPLRVFDKDLLEFRKASPTERGMLFFVQVPEPLGIEKMYWAGEPSHWKPIDESFAMTKVKPGLWALVVPEEVTRGHHPLQFKFYQHIPSRHFEDPRTLWLTGSYPVHNETGNASIYLEQDNPLMSREAAARILRGFGAIARSEARGPIEEYQDEIRKGLVTFVMFKPDAMVKDPKTKKFIFQEILEALIQKGFEILVLGAPTRFTEEQAREFYAAHKGQWFYEPLVNYILGKKPKSEGSLVPVLLRYRQGKAVEAIQNILPELRAKFGEKKGDRETTIDINRMHASDSMDKIFLEGGIAFRSEARRTERSWPRHEPQKIAVIGTGFVGATKAILLVTDWGHDVIGVDIQPAVVEKLSKGQLTFHADDLQVLLREALGTQRLAFTVDYAKAIEGREIIYLAVQTPQSETGHANINYLKESVRAIASLVKPGESKIIIGKSTAPPRDTVAVLKEIVKEEFKRRETAGEDLRGAKIHFAWEPEFLREGKEVEDDRGEAGRIVIGADDPAIAEKIKQIYASANPEPDHARKEVPVLITDLTSAPLVKYAANGYRGMKISFINFIGWLTEALGFNVEDVADAIGSDPRIRRSFLSAGLGFGGSCFPKDLAAFVQIARKNGVLPGLVLDALAVNRLQVHRFVEKLIVPQLKNVQDKTIVVLGASFKPGTDDIRESRSVKIIRMLLRRGAKIRVYDPVAVPRLRDPRNGPLRNDIEVKYFDRPEQIDGMLQGADAIVLATEWPEFKMIDFKALRHWYLDRGKPLPAIFDGRNFFNDAIQINPVDESSASATAQRASKYPYFNIGRAENGAAAQVEREEFIEDVREFFLALRISYINMIAEIAEHIDANIRDVKMGLGLDPVVGVDYLHPGIGWGGNKLSSAIEALAAHAREHLPDLLQYFGKIRRKIQNEFEFKPGDAREEQTPVPFISTVKELNEEQIGLYIKKAREAAGGDLRGKVVAVLGLAYKPGEYATHESRALSLIEALLKEGAIVRATDVNQQTIPNAIDELVERGVRADPEKLIFVSEHKTAQENAMETIRGSDLQILVTASSAFAEINKIFFERGKPVAKTSRMVDGRHFFIPKQLEDHGIGYFAVGVPSNARVKEEALKSVRIPKSMEELTRGLRFPEKNIRIVPLDSGRFLVGLKVQGEKGTLAALNFFVHFGPREVPAPALIPWHDQKADAILLVRKSGEEEEYEIQTVIEPGKAFPDRSGHFGVTLFAMSPRIAQQDAAFVTERFWVGQQGSVKDGEFKVEPADESVEKKASPRSEARFFSVFPSFKGTRAEVLDEIEDQLIELQRKGPPANREKVRNLERVRDEIKAAKLEPDDSIRILNTLDGEDYGFQPPLRSEARPVSQAEVNAFVDQLTKNILSRKNQDFPKAVRADLHGARVAVSYDGNWEDFKGFIQWADGTLEFHSKGSVFRFGLHESALTYQEETEQNGSKKFISHTVVHFSGVFPLQAILKAKKNDHRLWFVDASNKFAGNASLNKFVMGLGFGPIFRADQYQKIKRENELLVDMDQVKLKTGKPAIRVVVRKKEIQQLPGGASREPLPLRSEARTTEYSLDPLVKQHLIVHSRTESRPPQAVPLPQTSTLGREPWTVKKLLAKNRELGGSGTLQGFEGVTDKIMGGIVSLVAHTLGVDAAEIAISLLPASLAQNAAKTLAQARLAKARERLGIKTIQPGDVFILGRELALTLGFLEAVRDILGNKPVAVAVQNDGDITRLKQFNSELAESERVIMTSDDERILSVHADSVMSVKKAGIELKHRAGTGHANLRVLLYGAETLKGAIPDAIQRITRQMFQNFIRMAGVDVAERISRMAEEFRATSRSA